MPKDALTIRRDRRPAGFCQEQTLVLTEQFSSMEHVTHFMLRICQIKHRKPYSMVMP